MSSCKYLGSFGCSLCPIQFKDIIKANNHAWSAHGTGRHTFDLLPTVTFLILEAQVGTRFAHMQFTQLEEKARDNKLKRCILSELLVESNFAATDSHFYRLANNRAACFRKTQGRLRSFRIRCADGVVKIIINLNEPESLPIWKRVQPVLILDAQVFGIHVNHHHNLSMSDPVISSFVTQATTTLKQLSMVGPVIQKILSFICKMCVAVRSAFDPTTVILLVTDALITSGLDVSLATKAVDSVKKYISVAFNFLQGKLMAQNDSIDPVTALTTLVAVLGGTMAMKSIPRGSQIDECVMGITKLGSLARGATFAWAGLEKLFSFILTKIYEWHTGYPSSITEMETFVAGTQAWYTKVQDLVSLYTPDEIARNSEKCAEIETLYSEGVRMSAMIQEFKLDGRTTSAFQTHLRVVASYYDKAQTSGAFRGGPRIEPLIIYIYGESGVGKSGMTFPLAIDLLKIDGIPDGDYTREIYMRNVEQEYWDGYRQQRCTIYDDFGQNVDSVSHPNPEFMELIRTGNLAAYPLHMASIEDKSKTYFKSRVVICTSNTSVRNLRPVSIGHPEAVKRRLDLCGRVVNKREFTSLDGNRQARLDPEKVHNVTGHDISMDVYRIELIDSATGEGSGEYMEYADFAALAARKYRARFTRSQALFNFLANHAAGPAIPDPLAAQVSSDEVMLSIHPRARVVLKEPKSVFSNMTIKGVGEFFDDLAELRDLFTEDFLSDLDDFELTWMDPNDNVALHWKMAADAWHNLLNRTTIFYNEEAESIVLAIFKTRAQMSHISRTGSGSLADQCSEFSDYVDTVEIAPESFCKRTLRKLERVAAEAKSSFSEFCQKVIDTVKEHPWYTALLVILPMAILALWAMYPSKKKTLTALTHHHEGLDQGHRREHSHKCQWCDKLFTHSHEIKSFEESVQYPQLCVACSEKGVVSEYLGENHVVLSNAKHQKDIHLSTELSASGDAKTSKKPIIRTELSASGDSQTIKRQTIRTELTSSGDVTTTKKAIVRTEAKKAIFITESDIGEEDGLYEYKPQALEAQLAMDPNALGISNRVLNNSYNLELEIDGKWSTKIKCVILRGRVALTVAHLRPYLEQATAIKIWNQTKRDGHYFPINKIKWEQVNAADGEGKDQLLIAFPPTLHDHGDLLGSVCDSPTMGKFNSVNGVLVIPCDNGAVMRFGIIKSCDRHSVDYHDGDRKYNIRDRYEYNTLETTRGDCGSILIGVNTKLQKKILGIHVAGTYGLGVASPLNIRDINECIKKLPYDAQVKMDLSPYLAREGAAHNVRIPEGNFTPVGKSLYPVFGASKTQLRPSAVHGMITEVTTAPSVLRPVIINGQRIDPMQLGLKKAGKIPPFLDDDILDACINDVTQLVNSNPASDHSRILTPMEAVTGLEGDEFLGPIKRRSSPGYPWIKDKVGLGKMKWLGNDEDYKLDSDLAEIMNTRIEMAKNNERYPTIWTDTLKDERRPHAKVAIAKTRVFAAGPMDFTLVFRMYFLGFAAHISRNRIDNEISVGTNVYSYDWTRTAKKMGSKGKKVIAGDFSNFDGTLVLQILDRILDIVNDFYDDGSENAQIRRVLWREITNSVHVCGDNVYLWTHSQPSGCPITAILNSLFNSVSMRYVWMLVVQEDLRTMKDFRRCVAMVSYGDDNLVNISDEIIDQFNQVTIATGYATIGMIYTDEAKSGDMIPFRSLAECSYLKRSFIYNEEELQWIAPLEIGVVHEMVNWIRGDLDVEENTSMNLETSAFELTLHGKDVFDKWIPQYKQASKSFAARPHFLTYNEYRKVEAVKYGRLNE